MLGSRAGRQRGGHWHADLLPGKKGKEKKKEQVMRSKDNVKVMRDIFGAIERRDERRFLELVHPDCAMSWPPSLPYGGTARGLQQEGPTWSATEPPATDRG